MEAEHPPKSESLALKVTCCSGRFCLLRQLTLQMCVTCLLTHSFQHQLLRHLGSAQCFKTKSGFECKHTRRACTPEMPSGVPYCSPCTCQLMEGRSVPKSLPGRTYPFIKREMSFFSIISHRAGLKGTKFKAWSWFLMGLGSQPFPAVLRLLKGFILLVMCGCTCHFLSKMKVPSQ